MKRQLTMGMIALAATLSTGSIVASSPPTQAPWLNPEVNGINRLPMRANYFAFAQGEKTQDARQSQNYLSLNGIWRFHWVKHFDQRPQNFYEPLFDDKAWGTMPIPGVWELNGYGDPLYSNVPYPWHNQFKTEPPLVPEYNNSGTSGGSVLN